MASEALDLIIGGYHLREWGNSMVWRAFPAMLLTGDTALAVGQAAQAAGLLLLQKPLPNGRLLKPSGRETPALAEAIG